MMQIQEQALLLFRLQVRVRIRDRIRVRVSFDAWSEVALTSILIVCSSLKSFTRLSKPTFN